VKKLTLRPKIVDFLLEIYMKGFVTAKTQKVFNRGLYYFVVWDLRDRGIIREDGYYNGEKRWVLTERGKRLVELLLPLRKEGFI